MATRVKAPRGIAHVSVTINGRKRKLRYCARSAKLASRDHGVTMAEVLPPVEEFTDRGGTVQVRPKDLTEGEAMDLNLRLIWFGLLAYEPELTQDEMEMEMLFEEIEPAVRAAMKGFQQFMPSAFADEKEEDAEKAKGKPPAKKKAA